ncbi:MAG: hypothetical protein RJB32_350 [Actinomycetota bacterium]
MHPILTPEAIRLLAQVGEIDSKTDLLAVITSLRKQGHDALLVTEVVTQARLRSRAKAKFGDFAAQLLFTEAALEQATRLEVAALHAERFKSAGLTKIADLGAGIGADSLAMSALGLTVTAVEQDSQTAALLAFNLAMFSDARVLNQSAEDLGFEDFDGLWLDPARRNLDRKSERHITLKPEDFSPNLNWAFALEKPKGIKLGPAFPLELIPSEAQAQWLSHAGDLVELVLWFDALRTEGQRVATMLRASERHEFSGSGLVQAPVGELGEFIHEPDSSLIRSGLMGEFALKHSLSAISDSIAYLSSSSEFRSPWLKTYRVIKVLPFDEREIRKELSARNIGILEIKKRGVDVTPEELRPKLKLKGEGAATLILTRVSGARKALLAEPIR